MTATEYTPTDDEMRDAATNLERALTPDAWDRWLAAHRVDVLTKALLNGAALPAGESHPDQSDAQHRAIDVILDHLDPPDQRLGNTGWCMNVEKIVRALAAHGLLRFDAEAVAR